MLYSTQYRFARVARAFQLVPRATTGKRKTKDLHEDLRIHHPFEIFAIYFQNATAASGKLATITYYYEKPALAQRAGKIREFLDLLNAATHQILWP